MATVLAAPSAGLAALPIGVLCAHAGERVILRPGAGGAELGVVLLDTATIDAVRAALRLAFSSAVAFEAGLAFSADGRHLLLSTWLPGVAGWPQARAALADLLDQCAAWHALMPGAASPARPAGMPFDLAATRQRDRLIGLMQGQRA